MNVHHSSFQNISCKIFENGGINESHLSKFVTAKKAVNHIFDDIESLLKDVFEFYKNGDNIMNVDLKRNELLEETSISINRIKVIKSILMRDTMKVAFFGRTSNGKSTVINAILGDKILPSGIGHTTSCFVSLRGCSEIEPFVVAPESTDKLSVQDLRQLASALSNSTLAPNNLVNVYWPISRCPILKHQVSFLDSPGIDVDHDLDTWIDQYCRDADVFVLVVNSESTLNNSEKKFFHQVRKCISSPNIFIVNNRWDASAGEFEIEAIKAQHMKRCVDFLTKELNCVSHEEALDRVYFTSAYEALYNKTKTASGINDRIEATVGFHDRIAEFAKFEDHLQLTLYRSAISTKFSSHCNQADSILTNLANHLDKVMEICKSEKLNNEHELSRLHNRYETIVSKINSNFEVFSKDIVNVSKLVQQKIYTVLCQEISNFGEIVNSFPYPFNSDPSFIELFKKELINYINEKLEKNVLLQISGQLSMTIQTVQKKIQDFAHNVVSDHRDEVIWSKIQSSIDIDWYHTFDVTSLCTDFNENLSFQIFFNPLSLVTWCLRRISTRTIIGGENVENSDSLNTSAVSLSDVDGVRRRQSGVALNDHSPNVQRSIDDLTASITIFTCICACIGAKLIGPRVLIYSGSFVGLASSVKWLMWTNSAKRDAFLRQFVFHLEKRLNNSFKGICIQNGKMIDRSLNQLLRDTKTLIDGYVSKLEQGIRNAESCGKNIDNYISHTLDMRTKCRDLHKILTSLTIQYEFQHPTNDL